MPTKRAYESSHPWITFIADLGQFAMTTWLLFGEAQSKCEHIAGAPLPPLIAADMHLVYLSKGIHGTASIEGNTLTESQVRQRIEKKLELPKSREYQGQEIDNILDICNEIAKQLTQPEPIPLSVKRIFEFNKRILNGLPINEGVIPGEVRTHSVTVGIEPYRGAPAEDCEYLLRKLVNWLNSFQDTNTIPELKFSIAVLKAIIAHLYLAWIHPFGDGNGRTARLIEFYLLSEADIPSPALHLLSNHYNFTRDVYLIELARTSQRQPYQIENFIQYALQGFVDQLRGQIQLIREYQMASTWENYVHDIFRNENTPAKRRQRHLVLDMPKTMPVPKNKLREVSARVAAEYAGKETKTISRDLNALIEKKLVIAKEKGYLANRAIVEAFLPVNRK